MTIPYKERMMTMLKKILLGIVVIATAIITGVVFYKMYDNPDDIPDAIRVNGNFYVLDKNPDYIIKNDRIYIKTEPRNIEDSRFSC